jgi:hypothetical protein
MSLRNSKAAEIRTATSGSGQVESTAPTRPAAPVQLVMQLGNGQLILQDAALISLSCAHSEYIVGLVPGFERSLAAVPSEPRIDLTYAATGNPI